jgi:hypothetical protein
LLHLSFNYISGDTAVDLSPQENDGVVIGDTTLTAGAVGQAFVGDKESYVEVDADLNVDTFTIAAWVNGPSERDTYGIIEKRSAAATAAPFDIRVESGTIKATIDDSTTTATVQDTAPTDAYFIAVTYDGEKLQLTVNGNEVARNSFIADNGTLVDNSEVTTVGKDISEAAALGDGWIDDVRLYDRALPIEKLRDLKNIGAEHQSIGSLRNSWDNHGVPFRGNNRAFAGALGEELDYVKRNLDYILDARHINTASGSQLDRIGLLGDVQRQETEGDARYRARIKGTFAAARSSGTFSDINAAAASVVDADQNEVEVRLEKGGVANVFLPFSAVDDTPLTTSDIESILNDTVVAGHRVNVFQSGSDPFIVRDDADPNTPANGLTSDSISTGGGLTSDLQ